MDFSLVYTAVKYLHILGAMAWIGGGLTLTVLGLLAESRKKDADMLHVLSSVGTLANRWFVPASLITLLCGIAMAVLGNLWNEGWVVLGLVGFAATFLTGHFGLRIYALRTQELAAEGNMRAAAAAGRRVLQIAKFDYTVLFAVVADMVFKPGWTDFALLGVIGAIVVAGAALFLGPLFARAPDAAASA